MLRVQLCENRTRATPAKPFTVLKLNASVTHTELVKAVCNKTRGRVKVLRLFSTDGTELLADGGMTLHDGMTLIVSSDGADYRGTNVATISPEHSLPPCFPLPGVPPPPAAVAPEIYLPSHHPVVDGGEPSQTMCGRFAVLDGNLLPSLRALVSRHPSFFEYSSAPGCVAFDYEDGAVFSEAGDWQAALLAECRGLWVCAVTGTVLARRFHKFYQLEELCSPPDLREARAYSKLDGTLVSPVLHPTGRLLWATRRQQSDAVASIAARTPGLNDFCAALLAAGKTTLFEWCSSVAAVGVLTYDEDHLVLLAVRHNMTGQYDDISCYAACAPCALAREVDERGVDTRDLSLTEGVVLVLPSGDRFKKKTRWYLDMVEAAKGGGGDAFSLLKIMLNKGYTLSDFSLSTLVSAALTTTRSLAMQLNCPSFLALFDTVFHALTVLEQDLRAWAIEAPQARQALLSVGWSVEVAAAVCCSDPALLQPACANFLANLVSKGRLRTALAMLDVAANPGATGVSTEPEHCSWLALPPCVLEVGPDFVEATGFALLSSLFPHSASHTIIPSTYTAASVLSPTSTWQLSLIPPSGGDVVCLSAGTRDRALFLLTAGDGSSVVCGVCLPTRIPLSMVEVAKSLSASFVSRCVVRHRRCAVPVSCGPLTRRVFCDLDGVLADFEHGVVTVTGKPSCSQLNNARMWKALLASHSFFDRLPWTSDGRQLWDGLVRVCESPCVLTGMPAIPHKKQYKEVEADKVKWCRRELGPQVPVITCLTAQKATHASPNSILIDDRAESRKAWEAAGGLFIHHISAARSLYELHRALGMLPQVEFSLCRDPLPYVRVQPVVVVSPDTLPDVCAGGGPIALDWKWDPSLPTTLASVALLATSEFVYVASLTDPAVVCWLQSIAASPKVTKVVFGVTDGGEPLARWGFPIVNCADVLEYMLDVGSSSVQSPVTLSTAAHSLLSATLLDVRDTAGEWSRWPPDDCAVSLAADAVSALLAMHSRVSFPSRTCVPKHALSLPQDEEAVVPDTRLPTTTTTCKVVYACYSLTQPSREELRRRFPPSHPCTGGCGDHVTRAYGQLPLSYFDDFKLGAHVPVLVTGYHISSQMQAVRVCVDGVNSLHITLSLAVGVRPVEAGHIEEWAPVCPPLELVGVQAVVVEAALDPLHGLPDSVHARITAFVGACVPGSRLEFRPSELAPLQRDRVSEFACRVGFLPVVHGRGDAAWLTLSVPPTCARGVVASPRRRFLVVDPALLRSLLFEKGTVTSAPMELFHGSVGRGGGIVWRAGLVPPWVGVDRVLVVMRGLPGAGKSTVAASICSGFPSAVVASADDFVSACPSVEAAHEECASLVSARVREAVNCIVIDNTNTRRAEYNRYIRMGEEAGYKTVVCELRTCSEGESVGFGRRSVHGVGYDALRAMHSRFELDEDAIVLKPWSGGRE